MTARRTFVAVIVGSLLAIPAASADEKKPAPSKVSQQRLAWYKETLLDAFERVGSKNPKWDAPSREALSALVRLLGVAPGRDGDEIVVVNNASAKAAQAGCNDPLVEYLHSRIFDYKHVPVVLPKVQKSKYHAYWQCDALVSAGSATLKLGGADSRKKAKALFEEAIAMFPAALQDPKLPPLVAHELLDGIGAKWVGIGEDRMAVWEKFKAAVPKERASLALSTEGDFWVRYAWDGRSAALAVKVSEPQWKLFKERLEKAAEALDKSWAAQPNIEAALSMIQVAMGDGRPRAEMEKWFARAVQEDPDDYRPYGKKLYYLDPRWHGSAEEMIKFGREVLAAGHWQGHYRILGYAHWSLSGGSKGSAGSKARLAYFQQPGVWDDLEAVYPRLLKAYPKALESRARFAQMAFWSGQWEEAERQFKALEGPVPSSYFVGGSQTRTDMREVAKKKLAENKMP